MTELAARESLFAAASRRCRTSIDHVRNLNKRFVYGSIVGVLTVWGAFALFTQHYVLGYDPQQFRQSTPYSWFLVDKSHFTPARELYVAFVPDARHLPWFTARTKMVKRILGIPGDVVQARDGLILLNGVVVAKRNPRILGRIEEKRPGYPLAFAAPVVIGKDQYLLINESEDSFDGRYWGLAHRSQLAGKVSPLL